MNRHKRGNLKRVFFLLPVRFADEAAVPVKIQFSNFILGTSFQQIIIRSFQRTCVLTSLIRSCAVPAYPERAGWPNPFGIFCAGFDTEAS